MCDLHVSNVFGIDLFRLYCSSTLSPLNIHPPTNWLYGHCPFAVLVTVRWDGNSLSPRLSSGGRTLSPPVPVFLKVYKELIILSTSDFAAYRILHCRNFRSIFYRLCINLNLESFSFVLVAERQYPKMDR